MVDAEFRLAQYYGTPTPEVLLQADKPNLISTGTVNAGCPGYLVAAARSLG